MSKCVRILIFKYIVKGSSLEGWGKVPHSKNSFGCISRVVSVLNRIQHVQMCKKSEFQVNNTDSFLFVKGNRLKGLGRVPCSKNSFWGIS